MLENFDFNDVSAHQLVSIELIESSLITMNRVHSVLALHYT